MRSTSCRQMASPSPVPPYLRVIESSACINAWNSSAWVSGGDADTGVLDFKAHQQIGRRLLLGRHADRHLAGVGKFDGVADEVSQDLAQTTRVAAQPGGTSGATAQFNSRPLAWAWPASISKVSSTTSRRLKSSSSKRSSPASILEKSRMSLITISNASALVRMVSASSRCSG